MNDDRAVNCAIHYNARKEGYPNTEYGPVTYDAPISDYPAYEQAHPTFNAVSRV